MEDIILSGKNLCKHYTVKSGKPRRENEQIDAVNDVSFRLEKGQILGIVGESGSGKSTLAKLIVHLEKADSGRLYFHDRELLGMNEKEFTALRPKIQMIFQNPFGSLDTRRTIYDNLAEVLKTHHIAAKRDACTEILVHTLRECALDENVLQKKPGEFSGGQLQRIAVARSLLTNPEILIADEITSALDVSVQSQILELLLRLKDQHGLSILFISHNLSVIRKISDYVHVMRMGRFVESGTAEDIFFHPQDAYTQALLNAVIHFPTR